MPLSVYCTFKVKTSLLEIYSSIYCRVGWTPIVHKSDIQHCESVPNFCFVFRKRHQQHKVRKGLPIWFPFLVFIIFDWGKTNSLIYYSNSNPWSLLCRFFCNFTLMFSVRCKTLVTSYSLNIEDCKNFKADSVWETCLQKLEHPHQILISCRIRENWKTKQNAQLLHKYSHGNMKTFHPILFVLFFHVPILQYFKFWCGCSIY